MSSKNEKPIGSVSNPSKVFSNARKVYSNKVQIELSDRKNKKYKIFDPNKKKWFHYGDRRYEDFTKHQDQDRRQQFRQRNHKWANAPMYSPAFAAYWLLW